jgi:hypothetical protein
VTKAYDFNDHLMQWDLPGGSYWPTIGSTPPCTNTGPYGGLLGVTNYAHGQYNYGWGAEGDLVQIAYPGVLTRNLHWDAGELLFVTNGSGAVENMKIGADAEINPTGQLVGRASDDTRRHRLQLMASAQPDASGLHAKLAARPIAIVRQSRGGGRLACHARLVL